MSNTASLVERLRAVGAKRNRLLMREAANKIAKLEHIIESQRGILSLMTTIEGRSSLPEPVVNEPSVAILNGERA